VLVASAITVLVGLGLTQLLVAYGRVARQNLLQEQINNQSRRCLKNLALGVRQSRRLEVAGDGRTLELTLDNGDIQEWRLAGTELQRTWVENGERGTELTMLSNLAPTSRFTLLQEGDGISPDLVECVFEVIERQRDESMDVIVLQSRLATRVTRRIHVPE